jgi:hypothetical protein
MDLSIEHILELAQTANNAESLCDSSLTRSYALRFSLLEGVIGLSDARIWLVGALVSDTYLKKDSPGPDPGSDPNLVDPYSTYGSTRPVLKQNIKPPGVSRQ